MPGTDIFALLIARQNALTLVWVALSKATVSKVLLTAPCSKVGLSEMA